MIYTDGSGQFSNTVGDIANYYNRDLKVVSKTLTADRNITSTTLIEIHNELRCNFLSWGDGLQSSFVGVSSGTATGQLIKTVLCLDGSDKYSGHNWTIFNGAYNQHDDLSGNLQLCNNVWLNLYWNSHVEI